MKRLVSNSSGSRWRILVLNVRMSLASDLAYFWGRWMTLLSSIVHTALFLLFLDAIFRNVDELAGYARAEVFLLYFMSQCAYYALSAWSLPTLKLLVESVRNGGFDLQLLRPVPILFYISTRKIELVSFVRDSAPSLLAIGLALPWHELAWDAARVVAGACVFALGVFAIHVLQFMLSLPAFWRHGIAGMMELPHPFISQPIPYEGLPRLLALICTTIVPVYLATALAVSVMTGRSSPWLAVVYAACAVGALLLLRSRLWRFALRSYTSASS